MATDLQKFLASKAQYQARLPEQLETMADLVGMDKLLEALALVCDEKADHVRSNWQDKQLARAWERLAKAIERASKVSPT